MDGSSVPEFGRGLPRTHAGGGFKVSWIPGGDAFANHPAIREGHYFGILGAPFGDWWSVGGPLSSVQAGQIDRKLDDGLSNSGLAFAAGLGCADASGQYLGSGHCVFFYKIGTG